MGLPGDHWTVSLTLPASLSNLAPGFTLLARAAGPVAPWYGQQDKKAASMSLYQARSDYVNILYWEEKCKIAIFISETFDSSFAENQKIFTILK